MKKFSVELVRRDNATIVPLGDVTFVINSYSHNIKGGPKRADLTAYASEADLWAFLDMLRYGITIYNHRHEAVWWGYISNVQIRSGWFTLGVDLENFTNKVRVAYANLGQRFTTDYETDVISAAIYGTKETQLSLSDATLDQANQYRNTELLARKYPIPTLQVEGQGEGGYSVTITCAGWFETLDWKLYPQPKGLIEYNESGGAQKLGVTYSASTISFSASKIHDTSGSGLEIFDTGDWISVSGTASNNRSWLVTQSSSDGTEATIEVTDQEMTVEASGTSFTIYTASSINQSFRNVSGSAWTAQNVHVRIKSVGSPSDAVWVQIRNNTSASIGALRTSGSIVAASITETMSWIEIPLSASTNLANNTTYWLSLYRNGPVTSSAHYIVDVNEDLGYDNGQLWLHSGSSYHVRETDADMPFKVVGAQETTEQIREMVQSAGQFFNAIDIAVSSSIMTNQYRDGETTALTEINNLLNTGALNGKRLLVTVTPELRMKVYIEPEATASRYKLRPNRKLYAYSDTEIELSICPVGMWLTLDNVIPTGVDVSRIANFTTMFVDEAEYFPETGAYIPKMKNANDPWKISPFREG